MEAPELAARVVAVMSDLITRSGPDRLVNSTSESLYEMVTARLNTSAVGARFLRAFEAQPTDPGARRDVAQAVAAEAEADAGFAGLLRELTAHLPAPLAPAGAPPAPVSGPPLPVGGPPVPGGDLPSGGFPTVPPPPGVPTVGSPPGGPQPAGPTGPPGGLRLGREGAVAALAVGVIVLLSIVILMANLVWPKLGLTEGARIDQVEGTWSGRDTDGDRVSFDIHSDGTVTIHDEDDVASCVSRVTSPSRSDYLLVIDCGIAKFDYTLELDTFGDTLTLTHVKSGEKIELSRD
jgi:hypothetical protein